MTTIIAYSVTDTDQNLLHVIPLSSFNNPVKVDIIIVLSSRFFFKYRENRNLPKIMEYVSIRTKIQTHYQSHTGKAEGFGIVCD